ncbi:MAG: hypothetical protein FWE82_06845, partial [Defluviitaleaceae bacterium]|nr:hypothetical protein [Defluviitaleaceae bacterium]
IYFCVKRGPREKAITNMLCECLDSAKKTETIRVNHRGVTSSYKRDDADLNKGAKGKFLYLLTTNDPAYNPIINIAVFLDGEKIHEEWNGKMCYVNTNETADLNKGAKGRYVYAVFKT